MRLPFRVPYPRRPGRAGPEAPAGRSEETSILEALRAWAGAAFPSLEGKTLLEIGGGGLLCEPWLEGNLTVVTLEQSSEAALPLRGSRPNLLVHASGLAGELERGGQYEVVFCHSLLNREEDPAGWLRRLSGLVSGWIFLETAVCDSEESVLAAPADAPAEARCFPSPAYVTQALLRAGFPFVYAPVSPPRHPEFHFRRRNNLDWRRAGRFLRCIFIASKYELFLPALLPLAIPRGEAICEAVRPRRSLWDIDPWPAAGGREPSCEEVARACRELAYLRPLVPYPGYKFDSDWNNSDLAFRMRRKIWTWCLEQRRELSVEYRWHLGLRLRLHLANDLSKQLFVAGCFDPNEFAFLHRFLQPGMTFLDAGAHEGLYALFASRCVGSTGLVLAFEPSAREFARLEGNVALNGLENVRLFRTALADRDATGDLLIAGPEHSGQNRLGEFSGRNPAEQPREHVPVRRLDGLLAEGLLARLDFLKIDVEGAEAALLSGAEATLRRFRPLLLVEIHEALRNRGSAGAETLLLLNSLGYRTFVFDQATGLPAPCGGGTPQGNILCLPKEYELPEGFLNPAVYY